LLEKIKKLNFLNIIFYFTLAVVIFAGFFLRLKIYLFNQGLWGDEAALAYNFINHKEIKTLFLPLDNYQAAPPLFLLLEKIFFNLGCFTSNIDIKDLLIKFVPFISSVLSIPLFYLIVKKMTDNKAFILLSLFIFTFNQVSINYCQEFKQYSFELLFSTILLYVFSAIDFEKIPIQKLCALSLLFCFSPWCSFSSFFIIGAGFLYLAIYRKINTKKSLILTISFLFSIIVFYFAYYKQTSLFLYPFMSDFWKNYFFFSAPYKVFTENNHNLLHMFPVPCFYIIALIIGAFSLFLKKYYKILFLTFTPLVLCLLISAFKHYPYEQRLILFLLPCFSIIYPSFILLIKENKIINSAVIFLILIQTGATIFLPQTKFLLHDAYSKEHFKLLDKTNEKINLISIHPIVIKYYFKLTGQDKKIDFYTISANELSVNMLEPIFKNLKPGIYYYSMPVLWAGETYAKETKKYILNNPNFKVLEIIENKGNKNIYLIKFKKVKS